MVRRFDFYEKQKEELALKEDVNLFTGIFDEKKKQKGYVIGLSDFGLFLKELLFRSFLGAVLAGIFGTILFVIGVEIKIGSIIGASVGCIIGALIPMLIRSIFRKFRR